MQHLLVTVYGGYTLNRRCSLQVR